MNQKDFEEAMEWLEFADTRDWGCTESLEFTWYGLDEDIGDLTQEQEKTLKNRLIECRDNIVGNWSGWRRLQFLRKHENIPKSRFWWYIDKL